MNFLKLGLISLLVFSILLFLFSLLIPSTVRVSRAVNIQAGKEKVLDRIDNPEKWTSWNELLNDKISVKLTDTTNSELRSEWKFGSKVIRSGYFIEESSGVTVIQWYFDFRNGWTPWQKIGSITYDKQFGPGMERSLNKLKNLIEKTP